MDFYTVLGVIASVYGRRNDIDFLFWLTIGIGVWCLALALYIWVYTDYFENKE